MGILNKKAIKGKAIKTKRRLNKKGIFFTLISITIMAVFIFVFTPQADVSLEKDAQSIKVRITSIDNYVSDLEDRYFEDVLRSGTHKTILSLVYYIEAKGIFLTDLNSAFSEVIEKGTINGESIDDITDDFTGGKRIMEGSSLNEKIEEIKAKAAETLKVDTTVTIKPGSIKISQKTPWEMESEMEIDFTVKSSGTSETGFPIAEWSKQGIIIRATTGIEGFNDPYYLVNTGGAYKNPIAKSTVEFDQWNIAKVREHLEKGIYVHWKESDAPSFLMRFTSSISPSSCCGIESFVNPNKLALAQREQIESYMDYLFWTHKFHTNCPAEPVVYDIIGLWGTPSPPDFNNFKLDIEHLTKYNIGSTDAKKTACP